MSRRVGPDVSRETPEVAARVFPGDRLKLAQEYATLLAGDGVVRGLVGPREVPRLWERHLLNCAALAELVPSGATVIDIGSGAGLPGLVVAIARPDVSVTLVEPLLRRTTFLEEVAERLGLETVEVVRGRAEVLHGRRTADVVTARAVAPLARLVDWAMPLVSPTGVLLAMKGATARTEVEDATDQWRRWSLAPAEVVTVGDDLGEASTTVVRVAWGNPAEVGLRLAAIGSTSSRRGAARRRKQSR
ncbi:MAG: 16S rRNA (guanine(527)-N(7))-methyltransferase RsmG [Nocardioidaceae bacterium]